MLDAAPLFPHDTSDIISRNYYFDVRAAHLGSLDAAKRLHEALLPGWSAIWVTTDTTLTVVFDNRGGKGQADHENAARSYLLAILKAYRSTL